MPNHPDDQGAIEKLHVEFINRFDRVNDDLMTFQDKAYAMGRARGLFDAALQVEKLREQLAEVIAALEASQTALCAVACLAPQHRTEVIDQAIDQAAFTLSHAKAHPINSDHRGRINE